MSISLSVKLVKPLTINLVLPKIRITLQQILGLSFAPIIVAEEYANGVRIVPQSKQITHDSGMIFFEVENEPEAASLTTYDVEHPLLTEEEQGVFASANVGSCRSPLEFALAAAVAATFARELGTPVIDIRPFYSDKMNLSADSFINTVKVEGTFDDYRAAACAFYDLLPRAAAAK